MMNLIWIPLIVPLGLFPQSHREIPSENSPFGEFLCCGKKKRTLDRSPASMRALVPILLKQTIIISHKAEGTLTHRKVQSSHFQKLKIIFQHLVKISASAFSKSDLSEVELHIALPKISPIFKFYEFL